MTETSPTVSNGGKATNSDPITAAIGQLDVIETHFLEPLQEMRAGCYALVTTLPPFDEGVSLATLVSFAQDEFPGVSTETSVFGQPTRWNVVRLRPWRLNLCRFQDACMTILSTGADGRRPESAKARNRGR